MEFRIEDMTCGGCVRGVTKAIQSVDPEAKIDADVATHRVAVKTAAHREQLVRALADAGFTAV